MPRTQNTQARSAEAGARSNALTQCHNDKAEKNAWETLETALAAAPAPQAAPPTEAQTANDDAIGSEPTVVAILAAGQRETKSTTLGA